MSQSDQHPILFLDIDDVLCLNNVYGGYDVIRAIRGVHPFPEDVYKKVFDTRACEVLASIHSAMGGNIQYVISSTWREELEEEQMREVFRRTGIGFVGHALHEYWCTPVGPRRGRRADDIAAWLDDWHEGQAFAIVDDVYSGPSLAPALTNPAHPFHGRVALCDESVGLLPEHAETLLQALRRPAALPSGSAQ